MTISGLVEFDDAGKIQVAVVGVQCVWSSIAREPSTLAIAGIKRNPRPVLRFEFGVVAVGRVWFRLDSGCRSPV